MSDTDRGSSARRMATEVGDAEARAATELDRILDEALQATFPASDPISVTYRQPKRAAEN